MIARSVCLGEGRSAPKHMADTVLVVGGGGREHAIATAIRGALDPDDPRASDVELVACAKQGNPGIERVSDAFEQLDPSRPDEVLDYAESVEADIVAVGGEGPLLSGLIESLDDADVYGFGPQTDHARIVCDIAETREVMDANDIPGRPEFSTFEDAEGACEYLEDRDEDLVVRPGGVSAREDTLLVGADMTIDQAMDAIRESDHDEFIIEEHFVGEEFSLQAFVANGEIRVTPAVRAYSRLEEGGTGPRTAGMGSYSSPDLELPFMDEDDFFDAVEILYRMCRAMEGYRGVLTGQFILTANGVRLLSFDPTLGDPEAMNMLSIMNTPLLDFLESAAADESLPQLSFAPRATVCRYIVPEGYPNASKDGIEVRVDDSDWEESMCFYGSIEERDDQLLSTDDRTLAVLGMGETIEEAAERTDEAIDQLDIEAFHVRRDIGSSSLLEEAVDHVADLRAD